MQLVKKTTVVRKPTVSRNALQIQHSSGQANIEKTSWVVLGLPKIGKSTLCAGFEGTLVLCTSEKEVGSIDVDYMVIDSWEKLMTVTDELVNNRSGYPQYKFLTIDFIDAIWTMCVIAVCEKLGYHTKQMQHMEKGQIR